MALQITAQSVYMPITSNVGVTAVKPGATSLARPPVVTGLGSAPSIQSSAYWKGRFDSVSAGEYSIALGKSQTADSFQYYNMSYYVDAFVSMFEATGNTSLYLDKVLTLVNNMINDSQLSSSMPGSQFHDGYRGWITSDEGLGNEQALDEFFVWRHVTRLLLAMRNNATVFANPTYKSQYDTILAFTEVNIWDKWYARGPNTWMYRSVTHISCHIAIIAVHLRQMTLNTTRQQRCDTIRSNIESIGLPGYLPDNMRSKITASLGRALAGAYSWNSLWNNTSRPGQDVDHGAAVIYFLCEMIDYNTGVWNQTDVDRFQKTLTQLIMPPIAAYVDGTGGPSTGWLVDGWVKLGRFSVPAQQALDVWTHALGAQYFGAMCVNAKRWGV